MISLNLLPDVKKDLLRVRRERNLIVSISIVAVGVSVGILVLMGGTLGGLTIAKGVSEGNIDKYEQEIKQANDDKQLNKYLTVQNQLSQVNELKESQQIYSRVMGYLQQLNPAVPNNVLIRTATISADGGDSAEPVDGIVMIIEGQTASFPSLDIYKNTLLKAQLVYKNADTSTNDTADSTDNSGTNDDNSDNSGDSAEADSETTKENLFSSVQVTDSAFGTDHGSQVVTFSIQVVFSDKAFDPTLETTIEVPRETTSDGDRNAPKETFRTTEENETAGEGAE